MAKRLSTRHIYEKLRVNEDDTSDVYYKRINADLNLYFSHRASSDYNRVMKLAYDMIYTLESGRSRDKIQDMFKTSINNKTRYDSSFHTDQHQVVMGVPCSRVVNMMLKFAKVSQMLQTHTKSSAWDLLKRLETNDADCDEISSCDLSYDCNGNIEFQSVYEHVKKTRRFRMAREVITKVFVERVDACRSAKAVVVAMSTHCYNTTFPDVKCMPWIKLALMYDNTCIWMEKIKNCNSMLAFSLPENAPAIENELWRAETDDGISKLFRNRYLKVKDGLVHELEKETKKCVLEFDKFKAQIACESRVLKRQWQESLQTNDSEEYSCTRTDPSS